MDSFHNETRLSLLHRKTSISRRNETHFKHMVALRSAGLRFLPRLRLSGEISENFGWYPVLWQKGGTTKKRFYLKKIVVWIVLLIKRYLDHFWDRSSQEPLKRFLIKFRKKISYGLKWASTAAMMQWVLKFSIIFQWFVTIFRCGGMTTIRLNNSWTRSEQNDYILYRHLRRCPVHTANEVHFKVWHEIIKWTETRDRYQEVVMSSGALLIPISPIFAVCLWFVLNHGELNFERQWKWIFS